MSYIRLRIQPNASSDGRALDCYISPDGILRGENVDYRAKILESVDTTFDPAMYGKLFGLVDELEEKEWEGEIGLTLMRLDDECRTICRLGFPSDYDSASVPARIWEIARQLEMEALDDSGKKEGEK